MLKQNWRLISRLERAGDFIITILAFFAAYYGRASLIYWNDVLGWNLPFKGDALAPLKDYFIVLIVALAAYAVSLGVLGAYSSMRLRTTFYLLRVSFLSSIFVFFSLAAVLFILKIDLSRSFIGLFCALVFLSLTLERYLVLKVLRFWRRRGRNYRNILICGVGAQAVRLAREIARMPELGIRIRGFAQLKETESFDHSLIAAFKTELKRARYTRSARILIGRAAFTRVVEQTAIDEVIFTDVVEVMPIVEEMVLVCSEQGIRTTIAADLFSIGLVKSGLSYFGGMPLIHFQTPPGDRWELVIKRIVDVVVSAAGLILLSPLFVLVALGVWLTSRGPILFVQRRVGLNGRLFHLFKFRSMYADANRRLQDLRSLNEMQGPAFKIKNDPRITPFGRILRRFSLDELPQLWNVLIGDMSLVGPRPPVPGEVSLYERKNRRRLSMRPGLTCIWQVSGRNEITDFDEWVKLDLEYIDNWSLSRDFSLLFRTIPAVIFGTGE